MGEYYVVFVGKTPGIYSSWAAAALQVIGVRHAIHQRYPTMEEGVRAWMEFFHLGDAGIGSTSTPLEVKPKMDSPGGGVAGPSTVMRGKFAEEPVGCHSKCGGYDTAPGSAPGSATEANAHNEGLGADKEGSTISTVMVAIEGVEGRVSQLEVDKWETLMQMAHVMEQMAGLLAKEVKK